MKHKNKYFFFDSWYFTLSFFLTNNQSITYVMETIYAHSKILFFYKCLPSLKKYRVNTDEN